jgi:NADPH:quinone reductase-like Zn-dependent oxidoreductase
MQTIEFTRYGSPDYLKFKELEMPAPGGHEVLVRIYATSINSWDWELMHAKPFVNRVMFGLFRPKKLKTLGFDIAGRVEAVGSAVKNLHVGDEVYGDLSACGWGGLAEYVAAPETALAIKPGPCRPRSHSRRTKGINQRCLRRLGQFRRADRQNL